ncbi:hypothetical protein ACIBG8_07125 [Nonomuraea sp. NPDC050556]|uniref:hypothetical protein n=1 Tax=Nonomuraea sp. NPDC050556 TaxID=3364369 RepID=UPI0037AFD2F6
MTGTTAPHQHSEYTHFGQRGFAQTIPTYASATVLASANVPNLIAVAMTLPAGRETNGLSVATIPESFVAGTWRAAIYDATGGDYLPLGVTQAAPTDKNPWWYASLPRPIPAVDQPRSIWVTVETTQAEGMALLVHKPYLPQLLDGLSYATSDHTELPARLAFHGWSANSHIPVVALS